MLKPQVIAIPIFAALIAIEAFVLIRKNGRDNFDSRDAWTNILIGFVSVAFGFLFGLATSLAYNALFQISPFKMPLESWWPWVILLLLDDFLYYWFHRISHESRFFWNFHVVHHSSNQYNLSVAVRQSWFSGVAHWIFYLPAALCGFPLWAFATVHGFNLIYQFWIHTELIDKMGPLEYVLNTPSHHRVHHGVNPQYLDKNYGGILIIWDRIFGSFEKEVEPVRYGITTPIETYNALWINVHAWSEMISKISTKSTIYGKLKCIFSSPNMDFEENPAVSN
ncbi:MAG: sterol desaturase family protein [Pyrinomonadaceae bacterium]